MEEEVIYGPIYERLAKPFWVDAAKITITSKRIVVKAFFFIPIFKIDLNTISEVGPVEKKFIVYTNWIIVRVKSKNREYWFQFSNLNQDVAGKHAVEFRKKLKFAIEKFGKNN